MSILHIDMVLGAFFAGIYIANFFKHKKDLPHTLHKVGFGFLVPIFFIYVGTTMDLNLIFSVEILKQALLILGALVLVRVVSSYIAYSSHLNPIETLLLALGDSMPLTFIIAIATIAYDATLITQNEYLSLIVAGMLSGVIIMSLLKFLIARLYKTKDTHA
jgi:Kef-type K+ transport system membrane component KefB